MKKKMKMNGHLSERFVLFLYEEFFFFFLHWCMSDLSKTVHLALKPPV